MKNLTILLFGLLIYVNVNGQDTISKIYLKNRYGNEVPMKKGKYIKYNIQEQNKTVTELICNIKNNKVVTRKSRLNGIPVGIWEEYNDNGDLIQKLDFDSEINYDYHKLDEYTDSTYNAKGLNVAKAIFPEGEFRIYIQKNMIYPTEAAEGGLQGKVILRYLINENGEVTDVYIKKGVHPILEMECIRAIKSAPKWTPAKIDGNPIKICYDIPLVFHLM